jgi:hypothetical protein
MTSVLKLLSLLGLVLTVVPSVLVFLGVITLDVNKTVMLLGTLLWFLTAPFWMHKKRVNPE